MRIVTLIQRDLPDTPTCVWLLTVAKGLKLGEVSRESP